MVEVLSLSALPARPPTPPRSSSHSSSFAGDIRQFQGLQPFLSTSNDLSSPPDSSNPHANKRSKRVNFSPLTSYIKPPAFANSTNKSLLPLRTLRPSNQCKPSKSILKSSGWSPLLTPSNEPEPIPGENLVDMLESVSQQLAGESRTSRSEAYVYLLAALKTYQGLPDDTTLAAKIGPVTKFIRRDICMEPGTYEPSDMKLITHALKLLSVLIWNPNFASHITDDIKCFILDHAVDSLQDSHVPKTITHHYMHVLSTQNFPQKIVTNSRVTQLLATLQTITDRVKGNAVVAQRLSVYQRLLNQNKSAMTSQASSWIEHLITGLLHNLKDTRTKAISLGLQAAGLFGPNSSVSDAVRDVLDRPLEGGSKFVSEVGDRLIRMMGSADSGVQVPQAWSIIILLLRTRKLPIDQWDHFKEWMFVIQKCFNCSDSVIKTQALIAWNRFVCAISPNESTSLSMIKMLCKPILSQFERKKSDKQGLPVNQLAFSSYCNLLYYALRPSASHKQFDLYWQEYVSPPFSEMLNFGSTNNGRACRVLSSITWNPQPRIWVENKANEITKLEPEDLPALDCKWVRSRLSRILNVFETLFKNATWCDGSLDESSIAHAWASIARALADASSKEIQPSAESMQAVANILGMFHRIWKEGTSSLNGLDDSGVDEFYDRFHFLLRTIISSLGPIPFTEKFLLKTSQETFQAAHTPTHRRSLTDRNLRTPLLHLLHLVSLSPQPKLTPAYFRLVHGIIEIGLYGRTSRGSRLELLRQYAALHSDRLASYPDPIPASAQYIWQTTSNLAKECLGSLSVEIVRRDRDDSVLGDYEKLLAILAAGTCFVEIQTEWTQLLESLVSVIRAERGENATPSVTEPLSEHLFNQDFLITIPHSTALLSLAIFTHSNRIAKHSPQPIAKIRSPLSRRQDHSVSCEKLMQLVNRVLQESYQHFRDLDVDTLAKFIDAVQIFLDKCPPGFAVISLEALQAGLSLWLADKKGQLNAGAGVDARILISVRSLSLTIVNLLRTLEDHGSSQLRKLEAVLTSGLESSRRSTTNDFIRLWNCTFGLQELLDYPNSVQQALSRLRPFVHLKLPSFPEPLESEGDLVPPRFQNSQDDVASCETFATDIVKHPMRFAAKSSPSKSIASPYPNENKDHRQKGVTPLKRNIVTTPKPRLRHDNSQIQFVTIEPCPTIELETDLQCLTENQREVRERQRAETATMFQGLRSSVSRVDEVSPLQSHSIQIDDHDMTDSASLTPLIPSAIPPSFASNDDEFPGSSPTPGSKDQADHLENISVLSSPVPSVGVLPKSDPLSSSLQAEEFWSSNDRTLLKTVPQREIEADYRQSEAGNPKSLYHRKDEDEPVSEIGPLENRIHRLHLPEQETQARAIGNSDSANICTVITSGIENHATGAEACGKHLHRQSIEGDALDVMPNSMSDELEQQIASQLEQDLELAMDLDITGENQGLSNNGGPSTRTRKRKREDSGSTGQVRAKRGSFSVKSAIIPAEARTRQGRGQERAAELVIHTPAPESKTVTLQPPCFISMSSNKRRVRPTRNAHSSTPTLEDPEPLSGKVQASPINLKRRRSKRLSGQRFSESGEESEELVEPCDTAREREHRQSIDSGFPRNQATVMVEIDAGITNMDDVAGKQMHDMAVEAAESAEGQKMQNYGVARKAEPPEVSILASLKAVLSSIKTATFGRSTLREIDDVMFDIKVEAHDAARRHGG